MISSRTRLGLWFPWAHSELDSSGTHPHPASAGPTLASGPLWLARSPRKMLLLCPCHSPGKITGVGYHSLLQGIFLTQGLNPSLLHWEATSLSSEPLGKPP